MNQIVDLKAQLKGLRIAMIATFITAILFLSVMIFACWAVKYGMIPYDNNEWLELTILSSLVCTGLYSIIGIGFLAYISGLKIRIQKQS